MAAISEIRKKSGLLIGVIGVALVAFLLTDLLNSGNSIMGSDVNVIGEINGNKIQYKDFEERVGIAEQNYMAQNQMTSLDETSKDLIKEQVWNTYINDFIVKKEYEKLGLTVGADELTDLIMGDEPFATIAQAPIFKNQTTGAFDPGLVVNYIRSLDSDPTGEQKKQWLEFEKYIVDATVATKYSTLVRNGFNRTTLEAKMDFASAANSVNAKIVGLQFNLVPDSAIKYTDADLQSYLNKNAKEFETKEDVRKIDFVIFNILPSAEDSAEVKKWVEEQITNFAASTDDSAYVARNSDLAFDTGFYPRGSFPADVEDRLFSAASGEVVGPVFDNGTYSIYKVSSTKTDTVLKYRASHILIRPNSATKEDTLAAVKTANELLAKIKGGESFETLARENGSDGTKDKGGDLGWFLAKDMVEPFANAVKKGKKGDLVVVTTQFGAHVLKITEEPSNKLIRVGQLSRKIEAGTNTERDIYAAASEFAQASQDKESFLANVDKMGLTKRVADNIKETDKNIAGITGAREIVRWVYSEEKTGKVSPILEADGKFIVAMLSDIKTKGTPKLEYVKEAVEAKVINEKKAEYIKNKIEEAMKGANTPLEIATKLGTVVNDIQGQSFANGFIQYLGSDNRILGALFGAEPNKLIGPIKGNNGVFVIFVEKVNEAPIGDVSNNKARLAAEVAARVESSVTEALKKKADIKDNRAKFY